MSEYHPALCSANRETYAELIKVVSAGTSSGSRGWLLVVKIVAMMIHKKYNSVFDIPFLATTHYPSHNDTACYYLDTIIDVYPMIVSVFSQPQPSSSSMNQTEPDVAYLDYGKDPIEFPQLPFEAFIILWQMLASNAFAPVSPTDAGDDDREYGVSAAIYLSDIYIHQSSLPP
jgi:hypothetical protein